MKKLILFCFITALFITFISPKPTQAASSKRVILDIARQHYTYDTLKSTINQVHNHGGDTIQLHFSDNENYAIESKYLKNQNKVLSKTELRALIHYANNKGITIIPDFDIPSHSTYWMTHLKDDVDMSTDYDAGTIDFYGNQQADRLVDRQIAEITSLFKQSGFKQRLVLGGDEVPGATSHQKDFVSFLDRHIKYAERKGFNVDIWNDSLTEQGLSYFDTKPQILYWKPVTLTKDQIQADGFTMINVDFNHHAVILPRVVGHEAEQKEYMLLHKLVDQTGFAFWGEWDEQLSQKELLYVIKEILSGYYWDE